MCLIKKSWIPRISLKDKKVYKVVILYYGNYYTPFRQKQIINPINKGKFIDNNNLFKSLFTKYIGDGYIHVYDNYESAKACILLFSERTTILNAIISKGTIYFLGQEHDIATRKIKYLN